MDRTKKEENLHCRATLCQLVWLDLVDVMWMLPARKGNMAEEVTNHAQPRRKHRGVLVPLAWGRRMRIPFTSFQVPCFVACKQLTHQPA